MIVALFMLMENSTNKIPFEKISIQFALEKQKIKVSMKFVKPKYRPPTH